MTDWIQVLLGQPLEEVREDGLEELNQAAEDLQVRKRQRQSGALEEAISSPAVDGTGTARAASRMDARTAAETEVWRLSGGTGSGRPGGGMPEQTEKPEEAAGRSGAEEHPPSGRGGKRLDTALQKARFMTADGTGRSGQRAEKPPEAASAGAQLARAEMAEAQVWRQSGAEFLEAESAAGQAERAAAERLRRQSGGSEYLSDVLAAPEYRAPAAGRLLAAMERNDRAVSYQTTERMTERTENNAWTGSDPMRLDQFFERDARRYDNGFTMF